MGEPDKQGPALPELLQGRNGQRLEVSSNGVGAAGRGGVATQGRVPKGPSEEGILELRTK